MASEIRVDKINSLSGVGTVTLSPTGVDIAGITTAATLKATTGIVTTLTATTGIVTTLTANTVTSLGAVSGTTGTFTGDVDIADTIVHTGDTNTKIRFPAADTISAETGGTERLRITSDGKVSVNHTATSGMAPLSVKNTDDSNINVFEVYNDNGNNSGGFSQASTGDGTIFAKKNDGTLSVFFRSNGISYLTGGEFGINTTAPVEKLGVSGNMRFVNPNDNTSRITALPSGTYTVGNSGGSAIAFHRVSDGGGGSDEIAFETHWQGNFHGERLRIEKNGDLKVNGGDLYFGTAGKGVVLGATSNTDANTLDDYEEGTWTPSTTEGMNNVYGAHYVKVGAKVSVQAYITMPTSSSGSNIRIDSFPFTSKGSNHYAIGTAYSQWSGTDHIFLQLAPSATHAYVYRAVGSSVTFADGSGGYFLFSLTYFTA